MERNDTAVFEHWYGKLVLHSATWLHDALIDDEMYDKLYDAFEAGLERGKSYDGNGRCCGDK